MINQLVLIEDIQVGFYAGLGSVIVGMILIWRKCI